MAEMSRLAYERFDDDDGLVDTVANSLSELKDVARIKEELAHFVSKLLKPGGTNRLIHLLAHAGFVCHKAACVPGWPPRPGSIRARSTAHRPETRRKRGISRHGREGISYP